MQEADAVSLSQTTLITCSTKEIQAIDSAKCTPQSHRRPSKLKWIPRRDSLAKRDSPGKKGKEANVVFLLKIVL